MKQHKTKQLHEVARAKELLQKRKYSVNNMNSFKRFY